jgi:phage gpG-like protein
MPEDKFDFDKVASRIKEGVKRQLPIVLANQAQNYFANAWREQGFDGRPWTTPKRKIQGTSEYKYPKNKGLGRRTSAILVRSGALRAAVASSVRLVSFEKVQLVVGLEYAAVQNNGNEKKNIPKRQFIGQTAELTKMQDAKIRQFINKALGE